MTSSWDNLSIIRGQWHTLSQEVISLLEIKGRVRQSVDGTKFVISQRERVGWTLKNNLMVPRVRYMAWLDWQKDIIVTGDHLVVLAADNFNTLRPEQNNRLILQIPQCIRQITHNAAFCNRNVHTCAHFCYKMLHCGIWDWCIMVFVWQVSCWLSDSNFTELNLSTVQSSRKKKIVKSVLWLITSSNSPKYVY